MPPKTNSLTSAPFTAIGSLQHWASPYTAVVWLPNDPFHATLRLDRVVSGRSAKYVIWRPVDAADLRSFPMFVADLTDLLQHAERIERGIVSARWQVRKRGQNYGLCLAS